MWLTLQTISCVKDLSWKLRDPIRKCTTVDRTFHYGYLNALDVCSYEVIDIDGPTLAISHSYLQLGAFEKIRW